MDKKSWMILLIIAVIVVLVILFWDKFIIRSEKIITADYCEQDSDCVWGVNPYSCCVQPIPMNKDVIDVDEKLVLYEEGVDYLYDYPKDGQCFNEDGRRIAGCVTLQIYINYSRPLICVNNKCSLNNLN